MNTLQILLIALLLDFIIGDPDKIWKKIPHPAVLMGKLIYWFDHNYNFGSALKLKGILTITCISLIAFLVGQLVQSLPDYGVIELLITTILLAHNSLIKHVKDVYTGLGKSLREGRNAVACIVGRQTKDLDESNVSRAAVESAAENFSDAVVAPIFWYLALGLPGLLVYKMTNTADSMIGYKSEKYLLFGYGAAKFDDFLNWVPARICGTLMCVAYFSKADFSVMHNDAKLHASPNAGWPEAAMASILNVALAGPRIYHNKMTDDKFINSSGRHDMNKTDIIYAIKVLNRSWFILLIMISSIVFYQLVF
ncbi:MAG: adenosylcobinamide-phosphate synthase CbiB [Amylibacter sp.]|nr:adenosylcobinamide-phosphate synthase CbiB [Amylibacter sp.]MDG1497424.1 adenosylcobinamide-phosphate synthase CbiB [Amylibacter sp.]MDG1964983.1 adenosylcobinamide-phosphate synthase CbiB [Amylibacter sp.]MDG2158462.1 adenosylcobinamide-phosphate synthase CbiB [Amylibacter sp.]|tara:strand:+ start:750 stop:1676 length:927 start_codon:yes stop_codon:yes gene_type:complete